MSKKQNLKESKAPNAAAEQQRMLEALSGMDENTLLLAAEEIGWLNMGAPNLASDGNDLSDIDRVSMVRRSRLYWGRDPLAKQAVRLYTAYALGRGLEIRHRQEEAQKSLDKFKADKLNRKLLSKIGLRKLSNRLLVDGELFLAVFSTNADRTQLRRTEPLQISEIISDPEDAENVWFFKREIPTKSGNKTIYYQAADADWGGLEQADVMVDALGLDETKSILDQLAPNVQVIHIPINTLGRRGYPLLTPAVDWSKSLREFMEDCATIMKAASQFAYKKTVKGGASTVNAMAAAMRNALAAPGRANSPGYDQRGPVQSSTLVQNGGVDTAQLNSTPLQGTLSATAG